MATVLDRANVDTDQIIPKQFLKKIDRSGFGIHLFQDWRYLDGEGKIINPEFELNQERYKGATVLVAGENFGCGSSREHAPWALAEYGFRVLIAPSFADIFYSNCFKNGILPVELPREQVEEIMKWIAITPAAHIAADLPRQKIELDGAAVEGSAAAGVVKKEASGAEAASGSATNREEAVREGGCRGSYLFEIDAFQKESLLNGWDDIDITLKKGDAIQAFEQSYYSRYPFYSLSSLSSLSAL